MTCAHVLGLIDTGPFANYPRAHLDAAWRHARTCPTCGPALDVATEMASSLGAFPQLAPPPDMAASIMERIEARGAGLEARGAGLEARGAGLEGRAQFWPAAATVLGGTAAALVMTISMLPAPAQVWLAGFRAVPPGGFRVPGADAWALAIGSALMFYVVGLFAPVRTDAVTHNPRA